MLKGKKFDAFALGSERTFKDSEQNFHRLKKRVL